MVRADVGVYGNKKSTSQDLPTYQRYVPLYNPPVFKPDEISNLPATLSQAHIRGTTEFSLDGKFEPHISTIGSQSTPITTISIYLSIFIFSYYPYLYLDMFTLTLTFLLSL